MRNTPFIPIAFLMTAAGFLLCFILWHPGVLTSSDTLEQYSQAASNHYNDWHPVMMAWWWHFLIYLHPGPLLLFIQNILLYWGSFLLLAIAFRKFYGNFSLIFICLGFSPNLLLQLPYILKDVVFMTGMAFSIALIIYIWTTNRSPKIWEHFVILILIFFTVAIKPNGLSVVPFVAYLWACCFLKGRKPLYIFPIAICALTFLFYLGFNQVIPSIPTHRFQQQQIYDLIGISFYAHQLLLPDYLMNYQPALSIEITEKIFPHQLDSNWLVYGPYHLLLPPGNSQTTLSNLSVLNHFWLNTILHHPVDYFFAKTKNFLMLIKFDYFSPQKIPNFFIYNLLLFLPWLYCVLGIPIFWFGLKKAQKKIRAILISFVLIFYAFVLPHFFIVPASDYRYLYFAMWVGNVALLLSILEWGCNIMPRTVQNTAT